MKVLTPLQRSSSSTPPQCLHQEKSAFVLVAEYASDHVLEPHEIRGLATQKWALKPSLFHISQKALEELGTSIGLHPEVSKRAFGRDIAPDRPTRNLVAELRYCAVCIHSGCHSALFQLPAISHCPVHAVRLRCGCPFCGAAIHATAASVGRNHLYCGKCGRNMAGDRRRDSPAGNTLQLADQVFEALRAAARTSSNEQRSQVRLDLPPEEIAASVGLSRLSASHTLWAEQPIRGLGQFRVNRLVLDDEADPPVPPRAYALGRNAYISAFGELAGDLARFVKLDAMPNGAESGRHSGARIDEELQLVSAAFWHAAASFGVHRFVRGEMPPPVASPSPFAFSLPQVTQAMRHVARCQVQTLFVLNVLRFRRLKFGAQIAWSEVVEPAKFLVPWRLLKWDESGRLELQVRARVDATTISRVVARYRQRRLMKVPAELELTAILGDGQELAQQTLGR
jgi:hypothetical protein